MGLFDFFKKKPEIKQEKIPLVDLPEFISSRRANIKKQEYEVYLLVNTKLSYLITDLKGRINILENINLDEKKVEARAKFIVKENLSHYLSHLKKLLRDLQEIKTENIHHLISIIDSVFLDFDKKSRLNYEKATFLIGKEIGETKDKINNFFTEIKSILSKNKNIIEENKIFSFIEIKLKELNDLDKIESEINKRISINNEKIKRLDIESDILENNCSEIKKSFEYKKEMENLEKKESVEKANEKIIYELKQLIDFKKLANFYHNNTKKMSIINNYKDSFKSSFEKDNGEEMLLLLSESNLTDSFISKKITEIKEKVKDFNRRFNNLSLPESKKIKDIVEKIKDLKFDIDNITLENFKENKKLEKLNENKGVIECDIRNELIKINVELIR